MEISKVRDTAVCFQYHCRYMFDGWGLHSWRKMLCCTLDDEARGWRWTVAVTGSVSRGWEMPRPPHAAVSGVSVAVSGLVLLCIHPWG